MNRDWQLNPSRRAGLSAPGWILGFDVGGTKTAAVAGTHDGRILQRVVFASEPERGFEAMWTDLLAAGEAVLRSRQRPQAVGVSIGGPLDAERGIIHSPPNLPGWDDIDLRARLEDALGAPAYVEHDAKASALAEWFFGAARGTKDVIFLTFGTGLGAGLILGGQLYRGVTGISGEAGHWRVAPDGPLVYGKRGSWEGFSSGAGIAALARERFPDRFSADTSAYDVITRARAGDPAAAAVIEESGVRLGAGIAFLVDLLNPEIVVLGSLAVRAGELFLPVVDRVLREECLPQTYAACRVVPSALGDQLGDLSAICAALYRMNGGER